MRIVASIPVVNQALYQELYDSIKTNTKQPFTVIAINNSGKEWTATTPTYLFDPTEPLSCNQSWNLFWGLTNSGADAISILNDDIVLPLNYFERMVYVLEHYPDCGIVCPKQTHHRRNMGVYPERPIVPMDKREGWAFTIRAEILNKIPKIPVELMNWCGDDWIFEHTARLGFSWLRDETCWVYHHLGAAFKTMPEVRAARLAEKEIYKKLMVEWNGGEFFGKE